MAQLTVTEQDTHIKTKHAWFDYRWMRYFFSEDTSAANHSTLDLQRRAVWIAVALLLQALNEVDHNLYIPYLGPFGSLIPVSYTHLRAHETRHDLVCRLLLEKKK